MPISFNVQENFMRKSPKLDAGIFEIGIFVDAILFRAHGYYIDTTMELANVFTYTAK